MLSGVSPYHERGTEPALTYSAFAYNEQSAWGLRGVWRVHSIATVGNPRDEHIMVTLRCGRRGTWREHISPHTSQAFNLGNGARVDEGCTIEWSRDYFWQ